MFGRGLRESVLVLCLLVHASFSQDFGIPTGWRNATSNLSRADRELIAQSVIDSVTPLFNASSGQIDALGITQSSNMLCAIALHDAVVSNSSNQAAATNHLETMSQFYSGFYQPPNGALAAIYGYRAYGDQNLLNLAISLWAEVDAYFITPQDAAAGTHNLKTANFSSTCNGATTAGGVFYRVDETANTDVNGATIGSFVALSAHLYEVTSDTKYRDAAALSSNFIQSQLYNGTIIIDTITLAGCANSSVPVSYNPGFFIEGLSIYVNVTGSTNWTSFLNDLIATTIKFPAWTGDDGVMIEAATGPPTDALTDGFTQALKGIYIRGLFEAWSRSSPDSAVAQLIEAFVTVQYNALLDLASLPGVYQFSPRWPGPPVAQLLPWGQLAALDVLNSAIGFTPKPNSSSSDPTSSAGASSTRPSASTGLSASTGPSASTHTKTNTVGIIVGVVIAVVVLITAIVLISLFWLRRRRQNAKVVPKSPSLEEPADTSRHESTAPTPFLLQQFTTISPTFTPSPEKYSATPPASTNPPTEAPPSFYSSPHRSGSTTNSFNHAPTPPQITPFIPHLKVRNDASGPSLDSIGNRSDPNVAGLSQARPPVGVDDDEPSAIPGLIQRLNRAMAKLPPGGVPSEGEPELPPEYRN